MRLNYTKLDRAQVIDQTKLADFAAHQTLDLTPNDRNKVPRWMCPLGIYRGAVGIPCIVGFVLNALLIGVFMKRKARNAEPAPGHVTSEAASDGGL